MSETGFLNDLGLDNVEADPNYIADGQWPAFVFDSKVVEKKDGSKSWVISYKIAPNSPQFAGVQQDEWYALSVSKDGSIQAPSVQQKSWLKKRVLSLGVPESKVGTFSPAEVTGTPVFITIRHKNGYQNVGDVVLRDEATGQATPVAANAQQQAPVTNLL
ncbi:MAG TPA: hypothetical protein VFK94_01370 [Patescibacteria group bacterium]|nr:hypothetical protein [Patescibacteria group bacterium]